jgi:hypothetical protein
MLSPLVVDAEEEPNAHILELNYYIPEIQYWDMEPTKKIR